MPVAQRAEFTQWWIETEPSLFRLAQRYMASREAAQDLLQDVAILAIRELQRFADREEFRRWAHAKLRWFALDQLRSRRYQSLDWAPEQSTRPTQDQGLIVEHIFNLITNLPPRQRAVLRGMIEGRSTPEIARELQIAEPTVRSLQRFARRRLAALLRQEEAMK